MKTSDVLNKAADLIEERGWLQGIHGLGTDRGLCMEGGILAALGRSRDDCAFRGSQYGGRCPVYNAVMEHLGRADYTEKPLWRWNDAEERNNPSPTPPRRSPNSAASSSRRHPPRRSHDRDDT
jgi:hypothetical protein